MKHFKSLICAEIHRLMDHMEDPEKLLARYLLEMDKIMDRVRERVRKTEHMLDQCISAAENLSREIEMTERESEAATALGRNEMAELLVLKRKKLISSRNEFRKRISRLSGLLNAQRESLDSMKLRYGEICCRAAY